MKLHAIAFMLAISRLSDAFTSPLHIRRAPTRLYDTQEEKLLRKELEERNSIVENEEQYSVLDGAGMEGAYAEAATTSHETTLERPKHKSLADKIDRMTQPRAYPLFLAEKAAEFVESTFGLTGGGSGASNVKTKEKVVVLGTGWGATSFLKEIDTDRFDVTVISPRNYFLFTPMLAGASVGTVEFRSITEPIREVSGNV
jgi:hypothetical protein